jgi:hypothetical protein
MRSISSPGKGIKSQLIFAVKLQDYKLKDENNCLVKCRSIFARAVEVAIINQVTMEDIFA